MNKLMKQIYKTLSCSQRRAGLDASQVVLVLNNFQTRVAELLKQGLVHGRFDLAVHLGRVIAVHSGQEVSQVLVGQYSFELG